MRLLPALISAVLLLPAYSASAQPEKPQLVAASASPFAGFWARWHARMAQTRLALSGHPQLAQPNLLPGQPRASVPPLQPKAQVHTANPSCLPGALHAALADVQARFGPVSVISTHRPGARIRGGRPSLHASCRAVDFKPAPGTYGRVAAHLRRTWTGGVGTYSSGHIHIDIGDNYRWHAGR